MLKVRMLQNKIIYVELDLEVKRILHLKREIIILRDTNTNTIFAPVDAKKALTY